MSHPPTSPSPVRAVAIMGATATGKSQLAIALAQEFNGEIVSMDSRQVYRHLDIGTGKMREAERAHVPHHLLDYLDLTENGSAGRHSEAAGAAIREIAVRGRAPFVVGGTGLYFRALFGGLVPVTIPREELERIRAGFAGVSTRDLYDELKRRDPQRAAVLSVNDRVRITRALELITHTSVPASELYAKQRGVSSDITYLKLALTMPREALRARVAERTAELFEAGWVEEVRGLLANGVSPDAPGMGSLGYTEIAQALAQHSDPRSCLARVVTLTQQYAKRQETFFRSVEDAVWIDMTHTDAVQRARALVREFLSPPTLSNNLTR